MADVEFLSDYRYISFKMAIDVVNGALRAKTNIDLLQQLIQSRRPPFITPSTLAECEALPTGLTLYLADMTKQATTMSVVQPYSR